MENPQDKKGHKTTYTCPPVPGESTLILKILKFPYNTAWDRWKEA